MSPLPPVLVIGAGASGLTCGVALAERGHPVTIVARERARDTVSSVAAALWLPYRVEPPERVLGWAAASLERFRELARDARTGVRLRPGVEVGAAPGDEPWHALPAVGLRPAGPTELPRGHATGLAFEVPVMDTTRYVGWLERRFEELGGRFEVAALRDLEPALARADVVVNASGLGARELVGDRELFPIRGQVVRVARGAVERVSLDERDPERTTYVVPRAADCVLGGSAEVGAGDLAPDAGTTRAILTRCAALEPRLSAAEVLGVAVGLRPGRTAVRLEAEAPRPGKLVVHDYGHGGAGWTLSWGCAAEVAALVAAEAAV